MSENLKISNVNKSFFLKDGEVQALMDINIEVQKGEFVCIVGASGCGKSTLLRIISGLETADEGTILLGEKALRGPGKERGLIFQESRLFPWLSVAANIEFGIAEDEKKSLGKAKINEKIDEVLKLVQLENFKKALPYQLSGGMQQRISIARALVGDPDILLLDEPLGALDALTRIQMQNEILRIWKEQKKTMILVTHDIDEAIYLGDRIIVLSSRPGRVRKNIKVELSRPRERNSYDFIKLRQDIYKEFFEESKVKEPEYSI